MKPYLFSFVLLVAGCSSPTPSEKSTTQGEQERTTALWAKVQPLEVSRTTTAEQLLAALGQPASHDSNPESYSWGKFDAINKDKRTTRRTMFFAVFEPEGLRTFRKTEPIYTEGAPAQYREGPLMVWDPKQKKFLPLDRSDSEQPRPSSPPK